MAGARAVAAGISTAFDKPADPPAPPVKRGGGKKLILFVLLGLLAVGAAAAGVIYTGIVKLGAEPKETGKEQPSAPPEPKAQVFYNLPDLTISLRASGKRIPYLNVKLSFGVEKQDDVLALQVLTPRIIDALQTYLRSLDAADLQAPTIPAPLRDEVLRRVQLAAEPIKVREAVFRQVLLQ